MIMDPRKMFFHNFSDLLTFALQLLQLKFGNYRRRDKTTTKVRFTDATTTAKIQTSFEDMFVDDGDIFIFIVV